MDPSIPLAYLLMLCDELQARLSAGWVYGPVKDAQRRVSPYLIPWEQLSEEIHELDRDPCRHTPELLAKTDRKVCRHAGLR